MMWRSGCAGGGDSTAEPRHAPRGKEEEEGQGASSGPQQAITQPHASTCRRPGGQRRVDHALTAADAAGLGPPKAPDAAHAVFPANGPGAAPARPHACVLAARSRGVLALQQAGQQPPASEAKAKPAAGRTPQFTSLITVGTASFAALAPSLSRGARGATLSNSAPPAAHHLQRDAVAARPGPRRVLTGSPWKPPGPAQASDAHRSATEKRVSCLGWRTAAAKCTPGRL
jgi:hypothetical protein